jgi:hypothetical protein
MAAFFFRAGKVIRPLFYAVFRQGSGLPIILKNKKIIGIRSVSGSWKACTMGEMAD